MRLTLANIAALSPIAQAKTWAQVEDELMLDIDLGIGNGVTETDPVRVEAAQRLERAGIVTIAQLTGGVRVARRFPIPIGKAA